MAEVEADIKEQWDRVEEQVKTVAAAQRDADKADAKTAELEDARRSKEEQLRPSSAPEKLRGGLPVRRPPTKAAGRRWFFLEPHALEGESRPWVNPPREQIDEAGACGRRGRSRQHN